MSGIAVSRASASAASVTRLIARSHEQLRINTRRSLLLARRAARLAERVDDSLLHGQSLRAMGNALGVSGRNQEAIERHTQALDIFERLGAEPDLARTLNASVQPLILLGEYDRAWSAAERARELFIRQGDHVRVARLEINIGNLLHRQDRFEEALACYERAYAALLPSGDVLLPLLNKAVTLTALSDFHGALAAYEEARRLAAERNLHQLVSQADYNIAWLYYLRGEYSRAIDLLRKASEAARLADDPYHAALARLDLAEIYLELNLSSDAREMGEQAHQRFTALGQGYEAAKALAYVAMACGQEREVFKALELFGQARDLMVRERNQVWPSLIDLYRAVLLLNEGRLFEARRACLAALECFAVSPLHAKTALCDLVLGRIALQLGEREEAGQRCEAALQRLERIETPLLRYHAHLLNGQVALVRGHRAEALAAFQHARDTLETLRRRVRGEELKIAFVKNKQEVYERLVELALDGPGPRDLREAFRCVEEAKCRTLLDLIFQPVHAMAAEPSDSGLAHSVRELREELNWYYQMIEIEQMRPESASPQRVERFTREIGTREKDLSRLLRELATTDPQETELSDPVVCSLESVQAALPPEGVLVEYFQVDDRIVLCLLDRQGLEIAPVSMMSAVADRVRLLQFQLSKFRLGSQYLDTFRGPLFEATQAHLGHLFQELLAPVWPRLRGRHLVIVPHGSLHYVPFHALFDGTHYVVDACPVSYAPSASVYVQCHAQQAGSEGPALVLGIPDGQAPWIEQEVHAVAAALPGAQRFIGSAATREVMETCGRRSEIVHIASHGYFRPDSPMFSAIGLGDGLLNVHDLYRLRIPARLVTLSGCATGANMAAAGDELLGISRGLFSAGAQALLLSLWNVHDETTARLMTLFYGRLAGGVPAVRALRESMLALKEEAPHPYYWAPFTLSGKCWSA